MIYLGDANIMCIINNNNNNTMFRFKKINQTGGDNTQTSDTTHDRWTIEIFLSLYEYAHTSDTSREGVWGSVIKKFFMCFPVVSFLCRLLLLNNNIKYKYARWCDAIYHCMWHYPYKYGVYDDDDGLIWHSQRVYC